MRTHEHIDKMWRGLRDIINETYQNNASMDERLCLRDYAENISWSDDLNKLLAEETHNEKQHRHTRTVRGFSAQDAAKLILCGNVLRGSELREMPSALTFITYRKTAAEGNLIGWIIREFITPEWRALVEAKDYSELMQAADAQVSGGTQASHV